MATSPQKLPYSKLIAIVIAIILAAVVLIVAFALPTLQQRQVNLQAPAAYFEFPSESTYRTTEGDFLGIGGNVVVWVSATVKNSGNAAGGCTIYAQVTDQDGSYWTQSQGVYLQVGEEQTITFKFASGPHNDAYTWSVWAG